MELLAEYSAEQLYEAIKLAIDDKEYFFAEKCAETIRNKYPDFFKGPEGEERCRDVGYRLSLQVIELFKQGYFS